ncbi:uncharacterized protein LOC135844963 [Planococcus citri]|uniref:uncharacterized protein LOC135844963 n=1 Tax=Planococcus citri TaxID=170843 RepID=UPI0031F8BD57
MLKSAKPLSSGVVRYLTHSTYAMKEASNNKNQKVFTFDLKFAIKQYDSNYEQIKPLMTITNDTSKYTESVIVFPGFEGRIAGVEPLIKNLKRTVHCMQYPFEKSKNNISEITDSVLNVLQSNGLLDKEKINVLGHSYGGIIAVELIRRLEKEGKRIRLCLTDSSPYAMKMMTNRSFGDVHQIDEFEKKLILNIANCVEFRDKNMLEELLKPYVHWQDKMNIAIPLISEKTNYNVDHLKTIADSSHKVLQAIHYYNECDVRLNAETTLIRSSIQVLPFPNDFKLAKICKQPVREFRTDGHHMNMLKFSRTADLINEAFDGKVE